MQTMSGGCQCGRIRYEARVESNEAYLCHCRMCQRATGGVSIAFFDLPKASVTWSREPDWFQSSPIARRPFCSKCGTPLGFAFPDSDTMDLTVGSFDEPGFFRPTQNFGVENRHAAWEDTAHLPALRSDEWPPVADRWKAAGDAAPDPSA